MYQVNGRSWIALGDPVGPRAGAEELVWRFRELSDHHGGRTVFYQASGERLPLYVDLGLAALKIGEEARVPLAGLLARRRRARGPAPGASARGSATAPPSRSCRPEQRAGAHARARADLRRLARGASPPREKRFSVGAFSPEYLRQFPVALVRTEGTPSAFANLWPTGTKDELSVDLMRFGPDAPRGAMDYLFIELMLWGRAQGYRWFNLGMAPLVGPRAPSARARRGTAWATSSSATASTSTTSKGCAATRPSSTRCGSRATWWRRGGVALPRILVDVSVLIAGGMKELFAR